MPRWRRQKDRLPTHHQLVDGRRKGGRLLWQGKKRGCWGVWGVCVRGGGWKETPEKRVGGLSDRRTKKNTDLIKVKYALPAMWVIILDLCINPFSRCARCLSTWISPPHGRRESSENSSLSSSRVHRVSACVPGPLSIREFPRPKRIR